MKINKLLSYAHPDAESPTAAVMTDLGVTVMEEIVACTGCRPKVVRHLNMAAFVDAKPGFNPYDVTGEEATLEEDVDGEEIWRRVNPNRPPKEKLVAIRSKINLLFVLRVVKTSASQRALTFGLLGIKPKVQKVPIFSTFQPLLKTLWIDMI